MADPRVDGLPEIDPAFAAAAGPDEAFLPYARNEAAARPWAVPGTPGLAHRIGGLEKADLTGNISYDAANHERMTELRAAKVDGIEACRRWRSMPIRGAAASARVGVYRGPDPRGVGGCG